MEIAGLGLKSCRLLIEVKDAREHEFLLLKIFTHMPYGPETGDGYSEFRSLSADELREAHAYFDSLEFSCISQSGISK